MNIRFGKNSLVNIAERHKADVAVLMILMMFVGFLCSRALLSLGMFLLGVNALWHVNPKLWFRHLWWLAGVGWVAMYALSYFWSADKQSWATLAQVKLPVLLLPLSFSFLPRFSPRHIAFLTLGAGICLASGAVYSLSFLYQNLDFYLREYNISHMLPTPVYGDYICFSVSCALYIIWNIYVITTHRVLWLRLFAAMVSLFLAIYIHILASKSGLIALYLFAIAYAVHIVVVSKKVVYGIGLVVVLPIVMWLSLNYIPTLNQRKGHVLYTIQQFRANDNSGKLGDISRLISYDIAIRLIKLQPIAGYGVGDMLSAMRDGYAQWHPQVTEERNKLIPHNQLLTVALGCGVPAATIFILWVLMPLRRIGRNRESFFFFVVWLALLIELMVEPFLEKQFGVFVYLFFLLLFRHLLPAKQVKLSTT
jgi:O-antigen ligase